MFDPDKKLFSSIKPFVMKHLIINSVFALVLSASGYSQQLCVGNYWTEAQGKAHLDSVLQQVASKSQWEARANKIRQQILAGSGLTGLFNARPMRS